jgi:Holliday junction resolvasome RuvABC endonuclease subunit
MAAHERLKVLHEQLLAILQTHRLIVPHRKLYFQRNVRTALQVGQARGVLCYRSLRQLFRSMNTIPWM